MEPNEIIKRLNTICRQVFEKPELVITPQTSARDIENWDSLNHVTLIMEVERSFGIQFALGELQELKNIGSLLKLIENKIG